MDDHTDLPKKWSIRKIVRKNHLYITFYLLLLDKKKGAKSSPFKTILDDDWTRHCD